MASVISDPNGRKRIEFAGQDGKRRTIRLGKVQKSQAQTFLVNVEQLVHAKATNAAPPPATSQWLAGLSDVLRGRLAAVKLAEPATKIDRPTLKTLLDEFTAAAEVKPHVVVAWLGNSRAVAQSHYLQTTDAHFEAAAKATEKATGPIAESAEIEGKIETKMPINQADLSASSATISIAFGVVFESIRAHRNYCRITDSNTGIPPDVKSDGLSEVVAVWPMMSPSEQAKVLEIAGSAAKRTNTLRGD